MNRSKVLDPRFWRTWARSGALCTPGQKVSTRVSEENLARKCRKEGVDFTRVNVCVPRWAQSAPRTKGAKSALVHTDLIVRSDGSVVYLDGMMGMDSMSLGYAHVKGKSNPDNLPWDEYVASVTDLPEKEVFVW